MKFNHLVTRLVVIFTIIAGTSYKLTEATLMLQLSDESPQVKSPHEQKYSSKEPLSIFQSFNLNQNPEGIAYFKNRTISAEPHHKNNTKGERRTTAPTMTKKRLSTQRSVTGTTSDKLELNDVKEPELKMEPDNRSRILKGFGIGFGFWMIGR